MPTWRTRFNEVLSLLKGKGSNKTHKKQTYDIMSLLWRLCGKLSEFKFKSSSDQFNSSIETFLLHSFGMEYGNCILFQNLMMSITGFTVTNWVYPYGSLKYNRFISNYTLSACTMFYYDITMYCIVCIVICTYTLISKHDFFQIFKLCFTVIILIKVGKWKTRPKYGMDLCNETTLTTIYLLHFG